MSLRRPFAAVLQQLRLSKGLQQQAIGGEVTQAYVSLLEAGKATANIDVTSALAHSLQLNPATLFGLAIAAEENRTPREVMLSAIAEMEELGLADTLLPSAPRVLEAPRVIEGRERKHQIQKLKAQGYSRAQVSRELGYGWTTVNRFWDDEAGN